LEADCCLLHKQVIFFWLLLVCACCMWWRKSGVVNHTRVSPVTSIVVQHVPYNTRRDGNQSFHYSTRWEFKGPLEHAMAIKVSIGARDGRARKYGIWNLKPRMTITGHVHTVTISTTTHYHPLANNCSSPRCSLIPCACVVPMSSAPTSDSPHKTTLLLVTSPRRSPCFSGTVMGPGTSIVNNPLHKQNVETFPTDRR
jgi:hypothetical protein